MAKEGQPRGYKRIFDGDLWARRAVGAAGRGTTGRRDNRAARRIGWWGMAAGEPVGSTDGVADEPMTRQLSGWDDKLWWVHSEALYTTLLCYARSGDPVFLDWHDRIFAYTFRTFPNPDPEVREWIQIRRRDGSPQEKTVALPVKDPYHIARNLVLLLELLYQQSAKEEKK